MTKENNQSSHSIGDPAWVENQIRFLALAICVREMRAKKSGLPKVKELLSKFEKKKKIIASIGNESIVKIKKGVLAEVNFYDRFAKKYSLIPTLDAGCHFDFVGFKDGMPVCIDVTSTILCKEKRSNYISYGSLAWPLKFAEIKSDCINWFDSSPAGCVYYKSSEGIEDVYDVDKIVSFGVKEIKTFFAEYKIRYNQVRAIVRKDTLDDIISKIESEDSVSNEFKENLKLQIQFFHTFRYALNLLPVLSANTMIDFVGQHGSTPQCYHIHIGEVEYKDSLEPLLDFSWRFEPKVVRFVNGEWLFENPDDMTVF